MHVVFGEWTCLKLAVENEFAGHKTRERALALLKRVLDGLLSTATVHRDELEDLFEAALIDEPVCERTVSLLEALPEEEARFYAFEDRVVSWQGKSSILLQEIEDHYGFLGGAQTEWEEYLNRLDLPGNMWRYLEFHQVKAFIASATTSAIIAPPIPTIPMRQMTNSTMAYRPMPQPGRPLRASSWVLSSIYQGLSLWD